MGNPSNSRHLHLVLLFLQSFFLVSFSFGRFSPTDNHLVDCGSSSATTLHDHRVFLPDTDCRSARLVSGHQKISVAADSNPSFQDADLYRTARIFTSLSSYEFHISGKETHIIRLHFYPFSNPAYNLPSARFHVLSSGFVLLTNFTASSESPLIKEFVVRAVEDEKLVIFFAPADSSSFAFVNAVEVISAPVELIGDTARLVQPDEVSNFDGLSEQAMETLFRINIGGPKVTPFNDTLWRTWIPDAAFFNSDSVTKIFSFSSRIVYREYGASREVAPDSVYNSARAIDVVGSSNLSSRMTWSFPVDHGYRYLIRTHFCDIASLALNKLYFNVYINGYLAYEDFDISSATGQVLASPYFVDFVADMGSSGILHVTVGPSSSRYGDHSRVDGLLNGIEIMKLSNAVGSLDGELPFALVLHNSRGGSIGTTVRSLVCWFAFMLVSVMGFMQILRWRRESKKQIAWTPLPTDA